MDGPPLNTHLHSRGEERGGGGEKSISDEKSKLFISRPLFRKLRTIFFFSLLSSCVGAVVNLDPCSVTERKRGEREVSACTVRVSTRDKDNPRKGHM